MPSLYQRTARLAAVGLLLALGGAKPQRLYPSSPVSAESLGVTLAGPCVGLGYHNPDEAHPVIFGLGNTGFDASFPPHGLMREWAALDACGGDGLQLAAGELYGQRIAQDSAQPYIGAGYRVQLGMVTLSVGIELLYAPHKRHATSVHAGDFYPAGGFQIFGRF